MQELKDANPFSGRKFNTPENELTDLRNGVQAFMMAIRPKLIGAGYKTLGSIPRPAHLHALDIKEAEAQKYPGVEQLRGLKTTQLVDKYIVPIFTDLKNRFEHIKLPAKLLDYFLRSNKSNINQNATAYETNVPF